MVCEFDIFMNDLVSMLDPEDPYIQWAKDVDRNQYP